MSDTKDAPERVEYDDNGDDMTADGCSQSEMGNLSRETNNDGYSLQTTDESGEKAAYIWTSGDGIRKWCSYHALICCDKKTKCAIGSVSIAVFVLIILAIVVASVHGDSRSTTGAAQPPNLSNGTNETVPGVVAQNTSTVRVTVESPPYAHVSTFGLESDTAHIDVYINKNLGSVLQVVRTKATGVTFSYLWKDSVHMIQWENSYRCARFTDTQAGNKSFAWVVDMLGSPHDLFIGSYPNATVKLVSGPSFLFDFNRRLSTNPITGGSCYMDPSGVNTTVPVSPGDIQLTGNKIAIAEEVRSMLTRGQPDADTPSVTDLYDIIKSTVYNLYTGNFDITVTPEDRLTSGNPVSLEAELMTGSNWPMPQPAASMIACTKPPLEHPTGCQTVQTDCACAASAYQDLLFNTFDECPPCTTTSLGQACSCRLRALMVGKMLLSSACFSNSGMFCDPLVLTTIESAAHVSSGLTTITHRMPCQVCHGSVQTSLRQPNSEIELAIVG